MYESFRSYIHENCQCHQGLTDFGSKAINILDWLEETRDEEELELIIETCDERRDCQFYDSIKKFAIHKKRYMVNGDRDENISAQRGVGSKPTWAE